jgi:hypothetical protein
VTMRMPEGVRAVVVNGILGTAESDDHSPSRKRALQLDAAAVSEYQQETVKQRHSNTPPELQALYAQQIANRKAARALVKQAREQEKAGKECVAEDLYTHAASLDMSAEIYQYAEGVGRAGLRCGDLPGARVGLESAVLKQQNFIRGTEADQLTDVRQDMLKDQQYLIVVYQDQHETALARKVCLDAYVGWTSCACALKDGDVKCVSHP